MSCTGHRHRARSAHAPCDAHGASRRATRSCAAPMDAPCPMADERCERAQRRSRRDRADGTAESATRETRAETQAEPARTRSRSRLCRAVPHTCVAFSLTLSPGRAHSFTGRSLSHADARKAHARLVTRLHAAKTSHARRIARAIHSTQRTAHSLSHSHSTFTLALTQHNHTHTFASGAGRARRPRPILAPVDTLLHSCCPVCHGAT